MLSTDGFNCFKNKIVKEIVSNRVEKTITITFTDETYLKIIVYEDNIDNPLQDNSTYTFEWSTKSKV